MPQSLAQDVAEGKSFPLGATCQADGVNFSVYSKNATAVELLLFDRPDDAQPARTISLNPANNRTYYYWHAFVPGPSEQDRFMAIASRVRTYQKRAYVSTPARCCSIPTVRVS
jgi:pullulanase/glycogen debranching enzyme